ncbi:11112_t:CDS:2 [Paraglomus brasilianum]|uniref:11112_t:CDS:1 n=1 Tax=Paraglomus brasilianum TaxID=144538 RepID=A0A9N8WI40_9GLOM|nr:11112_t:CDS:2 [Paraglomus brasilianum]
MNQKNDKEISETTSLSSPPSPALEAQSHPAPQMFDAFPQSPHGDFKPTFYNPFEVKHRRRTSRYQLKVLERAFNENPKPHAAVRQILAQKLNMTPRGVQVWFQNRRAKAKKVKVTEDSQSNEGEDGDFGIEEEIYLTTEHTNDCAKHLKETVTCDNDEPSTKCEEGIPCCEEVFPSLSETDSEGLYVEQSTCLLANNILMGERSTTEKVSRTKPSIDPIKIPETQEEYQLMMQQRQLQQFYQKPQADAVQEWMQDNISLDQSGQPAGFVSNMYDSINDFIPLGTPQSAVSIPEYFTDYRQYSPSVSSVISDKYPASAADPADCLQPSGFSLSRRNSCPPELMASLLNMKLVNTPEEKQQLTTIIEDETLYNDANAHQFLAMPAVQTKRRFSEPVNRYIFEEFQAGGTTNYVSDLQNSSCSQTLPFNVPAFGAISQSNDQVVHDAPHLERGFSLDSALWSFAKERNVWNNGFDIKNSKQSVADVGLKSNDGASITGQWSQSSPAIFGIETVGSLSLPLTDDATFMQQIYGNPNEEVVV